MAVRFMIAKITSAISIFFLMVVPVFAESTMKALATKDVLVVFENGREETAREVVDLFLLSVRELKEQWNWIPEKRPEILLTNDRQSFFRNMPNPRFIAYAVPNRNLIVIDTLSALKEPFTLGTTLKHELVHIMLHYRTGGNAPRWLDEGIAQWTTSGIAEIIKDPRLKVLERAALTGRFIRLRDLEQYFPADDTA
ncbi:MAG: hypothetical protein JW884_11605, partial [Deltaproteobacteria bacterium]|nr:hypothetical protein [Deltaproteobacteria bacterium]